MTEYVLVLPRRGDGNVLLVLKDRPEWQKGRLNLVGGKVEPGETPVEAAVRELEEESGIKSSDPVLCGKIIAINAVVYCFYCDVYTGLAKISPREGETELVDWYFWPVVKNDNRLMPNLRVIIPLLVMDSRGWSITDQSSSLGVLKHDILLSLDIDKPFVNG